LYPVHGHFQPYVSGCKRQDQWLRRAQRIAPPAKSEAYKLFGDHFAGEMAGNDFARLRALLRRFHLGLARTIMLGDHSAGFGV